MDAWRRAQSTHLLAVFTHWVTVQYRQIFVQFRLGRLVVLGKPANESGQFEHVIEAARVEKRAGRCARRLVLGVGRRRTIRDGAAECVDGAAAVDGQLVEPVIEAVLLFTGHLRQCRIGREQVTDEFL